MRATAKGAAISAALLLVGSACSDGGSESPEASRDAAVATAPATAELRLEPEISGPPGSGEPYLFATPSGRALMTWHEPIDDGRYALKFATRAIGSWSDPVTVAESESFFVNWADFPSVAEDGGTIAVHWLERTADSPYAYHVRLVLSSDGGKSWSEPITPHRDESPTEHGFVSMVPVRGGFGLIWLDGRAMDGQGGTDGHGGGGDMSLRYAVLDRDGALGPELLLDDRTCECCQTAMVATPDGLVAAYRNRGADETRDIHVARLLSNGWMAGVPVAEDGWVIPGCPVNGPQLSARDRDVAIAWFTAPEATPQVRVAFSEDAGASFGSPRRVDEGSPLGRVDIELAEDGSAIVAWLEATGEEALLLARTVRPDGRLGAVIEIARTDGSRSSGFPRMAQIAGELLIAWTVPGEDGGVRVAAVPTEVFEAHAEDD